MESFKTEVLSMGMNAFNLAQRIKQKVRDDFNKTKVEERILTGKQMDYENCINVDIEKLTELLEIDEARMQAKVEQAEDSVKGTQSAFEELLRQQK